MTAEGILNFWARLSLKSTKNFIQAYILTVKISSIIKLIYFEDK